MFFDRGIMGLRPTQGDAKHASLQQLLLMEGPPSPLSSRPERSAVERSLCGGPFLEMFFDRGIMGLRPTQGDEKPASLQQLLLMEGPPSPLSSRPERSAVERSLCGCPFLGMFFDRGIMGLRPTQGDAKTRFSSATTAHRRTALP